MRALRSGPPLAAQILLLLLGGLAAAQLATLALTVLWPPPAPPQYRLEDIAAALGGRSAAARGARPLERTVEREPPSLLSAGWLVSERSRHDLARLTGAREADVRLLFYSPLPFAGAGGGGLADAGGPAARRTADLAMVQDDGVVRVAYIQGAIGQGGGFGGAPGVGGPGGGFGGFGAGGGFGGRAARGFGGDGALSGDDSDQDRGGRGGRRGRGGGLGRAGSRRARGSANAPSSDAPVASAPTTIDPPGSHDGSWLSLRDVTGAGRPGAAVPPGDAPQLHGRGAPLPAAASSGLRPAATIAPAAALAAARASAAGEGFAPLLALSAPVVSGSRIRRPSAVETTREADDAPSPRSATATPPPAAPPRSAPAAAPQVQPQPSATNEDALASQVAEQGVIAPAPLVAARSGDAGGYVVRAPDAAPRGLFGLAPAPFVAGDFVAAVRTAPGRWVTVRPRPEPFPNSWQRRVLLWFALAFALVAPAGWLFARRLARPLRDFAAAAERLGRDPSGQAAPLSGPAEIGRAARAFSVMQARLKRFVDDRTAMVGAISHDLRTPLARMRFRMERAPPALREGMLHDIGQMEEMISSVLVFIRDASEPGIRERVDLRSILECVVDDAALVGGEAVLDPGGPMSVEVDALGVQRVLTNLVDNALKYGARAEVRMYAEGGEAVAEVVDDGPGLAPEELERVFLPFYRSADARTLNSGGIGLGLAVSRSIARAHGGDVRLVKGEARGIKAQLRLPLAAPAAA